MGKVDSTHAEVIFQGAKPYWRTRNNMDIMLVHHNALDVIEIISYEPTFDQEAPRIYLNDTLLATKLDQTDFERRLEEAKEPFLRRREVPDSAGLLKDIVNSAKTDYILNRLFIAEFDAEKRVIKMEIQLNFRDLDDAATAGADVNNIVCEKPKRLQMYKSPHYRTLLDGMVDQMLEDIEDDKTGIRILRRRATQYEGAADQFLTCKDRWRIPIIFMKVKNGRILTPSDARIWRIVTRAVAPEVAGLAVGKVLDVLVPDRDALRATAAAALAATTVPVLPTLAPLNTAISTISTAYEFNGKSPTSMAAPTPTHRRGSRSSFSEHGGSAGPSAASTPTTRSPMNRTPTGYPRSPFARNNTAASRSSLLAGITASMKKRFGMTMAPISTEEDEENNDANAEAARTSPTPQKLRPKPKQTEAEPVNPRGTNISVTPKPRSYFMPSPKKARPGGRSFAVNSRADSIGGPRNGNGQGPDLAAALAAATAAAGESNNETEKMDTFESNSLSQRISAGFSAFSTSIKRTLSFKPKLQSAQSLAAIDGDEDEDIGFENHNQEENRAGAEAGVDTATATAALTCAALDGSLEQAEGESSAVANFTPTNSPGKTRKEVTIAVQENKPENKSSTSPKAASVGSKSPKKPVVGPHSAVHSRIASTRSGVTLDTSRTGTSSERDLLNQASAPNTPAAGQEGQPAQPQSAEDFRDAMLKKQADNTAKAQMHLRTRASFRENAYALSDSGAESSSPIAQFFSKLSPWAGSGKVVPSD